MLRLQSRELRATLEFLREVYVLRNLETFARYAISALPKVVASDHTSYNEVNPRTGRDHFLCEPTDFYRNLIPTFERHMSEHPLIAHYTRTSDGRALKVSDFLTRDQFHRLALYNDFFRIVGVEHQMAFVLPAPPPLVVGVALNRGRRDFSERDRTILNLLRPHVVQAYENAEAATRVERELMLLTQGEEESGRGVVLLNTSGKVCRATSRARQWLAEYFESARGDALPETLWRWVRHEQRLLARGDDVPPPRRPLVVEREAKRLQVRLLSDRQGSLLIFDERIEPTPPALEPLGLSRREAEVLSWIAHGKTNPEIATILGTRPRTVGKQLEHIYRKLGVENRTAAATLAMTFVSSLPS